MASPIRAVRNFAYCPGRVMITGGLLSMVGAMSAAPPRIEAQHGAAWWARRLGCQEHDIGGANGDRDAAAKSSFATAIARRLNRQFPPSLRWAFGRILAERIDALLNEEWRGWEDAL